MSNFTPDEKKGKALLDQKNFSAALPHFQGLWNQNISSNRQWVGWYLSRTLRGLKQSEKALEICRETYQINPQFDRIRELYAWCIYDLNIKHRIKDENLFFKAANAIIELTKPNDVVYKITVFAVLKFLKTDEEGVSQSSSPKKVLEWIEKLDPQFLSCDQRPLPNSHPYPSEYERYASIKSKALLSLNRAEEVLFCCKDAKDVLKNNMVHLHWFIWREGKAQVLLKQYQDAIQSFSEVLKIKKDWFVHYALAEAFFLSENIEKALYHSAQAALGHAHIEFKWKIYVLLAQIFFSKGDKKIACLHIQLAYSVRSGAGWSQSKDIEQLLERLDYSPKEEGVCAKEVEGKLQSIWQNIRPPTDHTGYIVLLHQNGKSGNIEGSNGKKYFFGIQKHQDLREGDQVNFNVIDSVNRKTGESEKHAVDVFNINEEI